MNTTTRPALLAAVMTTYFHLLRYDIRDYLPQRTCLPLNLVVAAVAEHYERYIAFSYHHYDRRDNDFVIVNESGRSVMLHVTTDAECLDKGYTCAVLITETADDNRIAMNSSQRPTAIIQLPVINPGRDDHYIDPAPLLTWLHYWVTNARPPRNLYDEVFAGQVAELV